MTDLRDQLADRVTPTCHPDRPAWARHLCRSCYEINWKRGTLANHQPQKTRQRSQDDFVADYRMLRADGYTRQQIADRLGMTRAGVNAAYYAARNAGKLPPERQHGPYQWLPQRRTA